MSVNNNELKARTLYRSVKKKNGINRFRDGDSTTFYGG